MERKMVLWILDLKFLRPRKLFPTSQILTTLIATESAHLNRNALQIRGLKAPPSTIWQSDGDLKLKWSKWPWALINMRFSISRYLSSSERERSHGCRGRALVVGRRRCGGARCYPAPLGRHQVQPWRGPERRCLCSCSPLLSSSRPGRVIIVAGATEDHVLPLATQDHVFVTHYRAPTSLQHRRLCREARGRLIRAGTNHLFICYMAYKTFLC